MSENRPDAEASETEKSGIEIKDADQSGSTDAREQPAPIP